MPKVHGHGNGGKKKLASGKQSSRSIVQNGNTVAAAASASTSGGSPNNIGKRFQHQNFNKNIYIGTKNAEKWERTRIRLGLKNDVEFVTYLLKLADGEVTNKFPERLVRSLCSGYILIVSVGACPRSVHASCIREWAACLVL